MVQVREGELEAAMEAGDGDLARTQEAVIGAILRAQVETGCHSCNGAS